MASTATPYSQVLRGSRDLLFQFWDPLNISGTVEARNFKFGTHMDHGGTNENKKLSYPQRKRASNMAVLYGADGISI